jgi:hypothetical protein
MSSKKASAKKTQKVVEDAMGLSGKTAKIDPKLARIFAAAEEEEEAEEETEEEEAPAPAKKSKPQEVQMTEESDEDEEEESEEEESEEEEEAPATKKSASFRPRVAPRSAPAVKTLGNISRTASSASDELSRLWESAPDVSKFFN